jgi:hypothetical protein
MELIKLEEVYMMKKLIKRWLEKLEKANQESFGSGPLDCCELSKKTNAVQTSKKPSESN